MASVSNPRSLWAKKRLAVAADTSVATTVPCIPKSDSVKRLIESAVKGNLLFGSLPKGALEVIIDSMTSMEVAARTPIIKQNDSNANEFYVLEQGQCEVILKSPGVAVPALVQNYSSGSCFGELALLFDAPRAATVMSVTPCRLWVMKRAVYNAVQRNFMQDVFAARHLLLDAVPMLAKLSFHQRAILVDALKEVEFKAGQVIIRKNDSGSKFYLIAGGTATVMDKGKIVAKLTTGHFFGERALMGDEVRAADVIAETRVTCYTLSRDDFKQLLGTQRDIWMYEALRKVPILYNLCESQLWELASCMEPRTFAQHEQAFRAGQPGESFYIVEEGGFKIIDAAGHELARVGVGGCFGERSLLMGDLRAGTASALVTSKVLMLHRDRFVELLGDLENLTHMWRFEAVRRVPLLARLPKPQQLAIATHLQSEQMCAGEEVIKQGESGDKFYLVEHGRLEVLVDGKPTGVTYSAGSYFGELALIRMEPRAATVRAMTDVSVLVLDHYAFAPLLGGLKMDFEKVAAAYKASGGKMILDMSCVKNIAVLGAGGFGKVMLVEYAGGIKGFGQESSPPSTPSKQKAFYALKAMSKAYIVEQNLLQHVKREKDIMSKLSCPSLVNLVGTGQDGNYVYMMMEAIMGGELFSYLQARGKLLEEHHARFYAAGVILALQYLHEHGYVYRDLKPENLLIDTTGYIKMTDFGFAKPLAPGEKTYTLCGTPEYLAPEVIMNHGHNMSADWWATGVLVFELLSGAPPFYDDDRLAMFKKTCNLDFKFPKYFSKPAQDLITKLLDPNPVFRLGSGPMGAAEIRKHPWFAGFNWQDYEQRRMPAPYIPKQPAHGGDAVNFAGVEVDPDHKAFRMKPYRSVGRFTDF